MCSPLHQPDTPFPAGASRRTFLRATGLTGAATAAAAAAGGLAAAAPASALPRQEAADNVAAWRPDPDSPRFTLVVMPDTQYLFDGASINAAPVEASLRYILDHGRDENIVFLSHLGDLTEHGLHEEFAPLGEAFELLDRRRVGYSVLAGNHDIDSSTDDRRGRTPTWTPSARGGCAGCPPSAERRPTATTRTTSSAPPAVSGSFSPSTGGRPPPDSPGPGTSSRSTRGRRSSSPHTSSSTPTGTVTRPTSPRTASTCGTS